MSLPRNLVIKYPTMPVDARNWKVLIALVKEKLIDIYLFIAVFLTMLFQ
jgi:hypothetical protein